MLEQEIFHTTCVLAAGGLLDALRFIDSVREDPERWHAGLCDLWVRAKLRSGPLHLPPPRWTALLSELKLEFRARIRQGFRMSRFLDEILSDAGSLPEIRRDIEACAGQGGLPWFFDALFGWGGPLRLERRNGGRQLVRLVAADTRHERRKATLELDTEALPNAAFAVRHLWNDVASLCDDSRRDTAGDADHDGAQVVDPADDMGSLMQETLWRTAGLLRGGRVGGGTP